MHRGSDKSKVLQLTCPWGARFMEIAALGRHAGMQPVRHPRRPACIAGRPCLSVYQWPCCRCEQRCRNEPKSVRARSTPEAIARIANRARGRGPRGARMQATGAGKKEAPHTKGQKSSQSFSMLTFAFLAYSLCAPGSLCRWPLGWRRVSLLICSICVREDFYAAAFRFCKTWCRVSWVKKPLALKKSCIEICIFLRWRIWFINMQRIFILMF